MVSLPHLIRVAVVLPKHYAYTELESQSIRTTEEMFDKVHEMRSRIVTSPSFSGDRILGAILFEKTMNLEISGKGSAQYLWQEKQVVPFLKSRQRIGRGRRRSTINEADSWLGRTSSAGN